MALLILIANAASAEDNAAWTPKTFALDRYEAAWARNPFNLKTTPDTAPLESFAKDLAVAGVFADGARDVLIVLDRRTMKHHRITNEANAAGLRLVSVQHAEKVQDVVAIVAKGEDQAQITYAEPPAAARTGAHSANRATAQSQSQNTQGDASNGRDVEEVDVSNLSPAERAKFYERRAQTVPNGR